MFYSFLSHWMPVSSSSCPNAVTRTSRVGWTKAVMAGLFVLLLIERKVFQRLITEFDAYEFSMCLIIEFDAYEFSIALLLSSCDRDHLA